MGETVGRRRLRAGIVADMRQDDVWNHETAQSYDTPGIGMFAPQVLRPAVDRLAELAGDGRALELAIGTGRVAIPLAERGVPVTGIDLSRPMIEQPRAKTSETTIPVIHGDMAIARAPGTYTPRDHHRGGRGSSLGRLPGRGPGSVRPAGACPAPPSGQPGLGSRG